MWGKLVNLYNWTRRTVGTANNVVKRVAGVGRRIVSWTDNLLKTPVVGELAAELAAEFPEAVAPVAAGYLAAKGALVASERATSAVDNALSAFPEARTG